MSMLSPGVVRLGEEAHSQLRVPPLPAKCPLGTEHGRDSQGSPPGKPDSWDSIQDVLGIVLWWEKVQGVPRVLVVQLLSQ